MMDILASLALNHLKINGKIANAGGRDRTPDLQPSKALTLSWLPLGHLFLFVHKTYNNDNI